MFHLLTADYGLR